MSAPTRCQRRYCGARLDFATDSLGRLVATCPGCERNRAGLCRDCPQPLARPNAMRCPACGERRRVEKTRSQSRRYYAEHRAAVLRRHKAYHQRPDVIERLRPYRQAYMREYLKPGDPQAAAYRSAYMKRWRQTPKGRASLKRAHRRQAEKRKAERRERAA